MLAKKKKVQIIDLGSKCVEYLNQRNSTEVSSMYIPDNMHFTPKGAKILARIIATELKDSDKSKKLSGNGYICDGRTDHADTKCRKDAVS